MTLTHQTSPNASELISDMIPNIRENLTYLDSTIIKFSIVTFDCVLVDLPYSYSYQTVTGVGFEPSLVILNGIASTPSVMKCHGVYGPSDGSKNRSFFVDDLRLSNPPSTPWRMSRNECLYFSQTLQTAYARIHNTHSDGFLVRWYKTGIPIYPFSSTAYIVATCFK